MMFRLIRDIPCHLRQIGMADSEGSVSRLSGKALLHRKGIVNPLRGTGLQSGQTIGQRSFLTEQHQQMDMVWHAAGGQQS